MDKDTLRFGWQLFLDASIVIGYHVLLHVAFGLDLVKRPPVSCMLTGYLLQHCSQETLGIIEARQPVG